jgi:HAD superfamily hydrolase (TIGR01484 family)
VLRRKQQIDEFLLPMSINQMTHYDRELEKLPHTYVAALQADVAKLASAIRAASEASIIAVGSGGSFTTASLLCNLHEAYTGRVSRPITPLELICNPTLASASPAFLISAEGKNPDIIEALRRARAHSARSLHVITNRAQSPLMECAQDVGDVAQHVFELADKDGYLATNSLLLDCILIARAYGVLDKDSQQFPESVDSLHLNGRSIDSWLETAASFISEASSRPGLLVVFSPQLEPVAADLESKLSESALLYCQLADIRSFAHGRHLWLAERRQDCAILALVEPSLAGLWAQMATILPDNVPTLTMPFGGSKPADLLTGLIAAMKLVSSLSNVLGRDPGRPDVPDFGRQLHYLDLPKYIPPPRPNDDRGERAKYIVLGAQWPSVERVGYMKRSRREFETALYDQVFRAIVFDYDGTLCSSHATDRPPSTAVVEHLKRLIDAGILVGIASGRGGSIQEHLWSLLPDAANQIHLGLYNGGWIANASVCPLPSAEVSEFLSHVMRIVGRLKLTGVPIALIRSTQPFQVSVRFHEGARADEIWMVIADSLRQAGLDFSGAVKSKHSVDILAPGISKSRLVAHLIEHFHVDPYEIITFGDQGAWPGNDAALLEHRFSLSVDQPSRRLDRGWKLAPDSRRDVDAMLWYLEHLDLLGNGTFRLRDMSS